MWKRTLPLLFLLGAPAVSEPPPAIYQNPPKVFVDLIDAPANPSVYLNPPRTQMALTTPCSMLTIADLAQPELKLGGLRFSPNRAPSRTRYAVRLSLRDLKGNERAVLGLPKQPQMRHFEWSPDGRWLAFTHTTSKEMQLWVVEAATLKARQLKGAALNGASGNRPYAWLPDSKALVVCAVPDALGGPPKRSEVPAGPVVQENKGTKASARTFQDLLRDRDDEAMFEYYLTAQVKKVGLDGAASALGKPELLLEAEPSPDGKYLHVESMFRPFSYTVPSNNFPVRVEVREMGGKVVKTLAELPLDENVLPDNDAVRAGPRFVHWRADAPATLAWAEALDKGDPKAAVEFHDRLCSLDAPFSGQPKEMIKLQYRLSQLRWGRGDLAWCAESWWKTRRTRSWTFQPDAPEKPAEKIFDRSSEDRYSDPGQPQTERLPNGEVVLRFSEDGGSLFLAGEGASPEGSLPFLDRFDLKTRQATRLWRCQAPYYESVYTLLDHEGKRFLTTRESQAEPMNIYLHDGERVEALTRFPHPAPQMTQVSKELIHYKRADGVDLSGTLYLPPGYDPKSGGKLPVLMWAYPDEFKSASAAGQVKGSPHRFVGAPSWASPIFFVLRGYAVLDAPGFPIVGEGTKEPNDTYVQQLTMDAKAAVDELARRGVGDPSRCAIGGHSYGAFTTANLLAHSDLFRAGIARSGAYNRTLTPFGFQSEERIFWEASDTYMKMSPFAFADKINEPLLLIHGAEDNNPGTFPIQSERLYAAIKGLGGRVRLVMLPKESHGYAARESVLHMLWEMDQWLEANVKNAPPR